MCRYWDFESVQGTSRPSVIRHKSMPTLEYVYASVIPPKEGRGCSPIYHGPVFFDVVIGMHQALCCSCLFDPSPLFALSSGGNTAWVMGKARGTCVCVLPWR